MNSKITSSAKHFLTEVFFSQRLFSIEILPGRSKSDPLSISVILKNSMK